MDAVAAIEKMGLGGALVTCFPERFEPLCPWGAVYLRNKATVLFHLLERRIGGKDSMRLVLKVRDGMAVVFTHSLVLLKFYRIFTFIFISISRILRPL